MNAPARVWSPQQTRLINWCRHGRGSAIGIAVAGAGKTTTGIECIKAFPGQVAFMAYNKKAGDEIKERAREAGLTDFRKFQGGTVHSFGLGPLNKAFPHLKDKKPDDRKVWHMLDTDIAPGFEFNRLVAKLVGLAKNNALGIYGSIDDRHLWLELIEHHDLLDTEEDVPTSAVKTIVDHAISALYANNRNTEIIDFDDMIYLPTILRLKPWRFQHIILDEYQDTNLARLSLVRTLLMLGGRLLAFGDPRQAIYGFTGADAQATERIKREFGAVEMPLTVSYRCPREVVSFARRWVEHIEPHPSAPAGRVDSITEQNFFDQPKAPDGIGLGARNMDPTSTAILCRNTKPLVAMAFKLIRRGIGCRVEGREIGNGLKELATRWKRIRSLSALADKLKDYKDRETTKLLAKGKEEKIQAIEDQVETLLILIAKCRELDGGDTVDELLGMIDDLFGDDIVGTVVLSTIHKSKGREWNTVYWLDRANTCPSKWARQAWQMEQEDNLCYVAATRAKQTLVEIICPPPPPKGARS